MKIMSNGVEIDATPEKEAEILETQEAARAEFYQPRVPRLCCSASFGLDGFDVVNLDTPAGLTMAMVAGPGMIWCFFEEQQPNSGYPWNVNSSVGNANVTARGLDYLEISVTDTTGAPVEVADVSVQVYRID